MTDRRRGAGRCLFPAALLAILLSGSPVSLATAAGTQPGEFRVRVARWPCRLVVKPTLLGVVETGWDRSPTLRRQCEVLAAAGAVVTLEWGPAPDSQVRARAYLDRVAGVVVARIVVPPVPDALELVAHELQHVIEWTSGLDFEAESERAGSGVWRAISGFETTAAIEAGRQVAKELRDTQHPRSRRSAQER